MTFEEFKNLALNPPKRNVETFFEVIKIEIATLRDGKRSHYPSFKVYRQLSGVTHTLEEAEALMMRIISDDREYRKEIYCFHIKEFPFCEIVGDAFYGEGMSWRLYDASGKFMDKTYCSALQSDWDTEYGRFRGRPVETRRFKAGDIVEVLDGYEIKLAVATCSGTLTIEDCWKRWFGCSMEELQSEIWRGMWEGMSEEEFEDFKMSHSIWDASDDQVPVIDGPGYDEYHYHVHTLDIMPLRFKLSKKLRQHYERNYQAMRRENAGCLEGSIGKRGTGLPVIITVCMKDADEEIPIIKFQNTYSGKIRRTTLIPMTVSDDPQITTPDVTLKITHDDFEKIRQWVMLNKEVLLQHWNYDITTSDVIDRMKKV